MRISDWSSDVCSSDLFTSPLWAGLLAVLFLGERLNPGRLAAFGLGFVGILVIVRPGFIEVSEGILIMLVCAFFFGATGAVTKWLTRGEDRKSTRLNSSH